MNPNDPESIANPENANHHVEQHEEHRYFDDIHSKAVTVYDAPLTYRIDSTTTPNAIYIGVAVRGALTSVAVWQIQKISTSGVVAVLYADGDGKFNNVWDNRASLSYA